MNILPNHFSDLAIIMITTNQPWHSKTNAEATNRHAAIGVETANNFAEISAAEG